jgi:uridine kinase
MRPADAQTRGEARAIRLLGIAGPSGSGKTTLAQAVADRVEGGGVVFALDAYYRDQRGVDESVIDVDVPEAIDHELALEHLRSLAAGRQVIPPAYDFATHSRAPGSRILEPAPLVVVEGLFALYWTEVRDLVHTRVFVTLDHDECLRRRIERDVRERGRTRVEVAVQYQTKVRPMYERYVDATRRHAHLVLDGRTDVDELAARILNVLEAS